MNDKGRYQLSVTIPPEVAVDLAVIVQANALDPDSPLMPLGVRIADTALSPVA